MKEGQVYRLKGVVQHYGWGGYDFIPDLLGLKNDHKMPFAELWMGAHSQAPSKIISNDEEIPLDKFVQLVPSSVLGEKVIERFGENLPFLFKVLDARDMLSIQVHPLKKQAENGFARENESGLALDASGRIYKDDNHKPEVHVALNDFWMLHSFRPAKDIEQLLKNMAEFRSFLSIFYAEGIEGLYRHIMILPQDRVDDILNSLLKRLETEKPENMDQPDYWALKAFNTFSLADGHRDRGIFSIYVLNLLHLLPGESTFQAAGVLHAYLHGTTIELMANSDNVLRGGLTTKPIDVDELLKTVMYESEQPEISTGHVISYAERVYKTPVPDFELSKLTLYTGESFDNGTASSPEILLILNGQISVMTNVEEVTFQRGNMFFSPASTSYKITALNNSTLFRAKVPL